VSGRRIAHEVKRNAMAVKLQAMGRGRNTRRVYVQQRHASVRIQSYVRMRQQKVTFAAALLEKQRQADMAYQLEQLQNRLKEQEQEKAAEKEKAEAETEEIARKRLEEEKAKHEAMLQESNRMMQQMKEENEKLKASEAAKAAKSKDVESEVSKLKRELSTLRSQKDMQSKEVVQLREQLENKTAEVVKLTAALATSQREVVGLKTKCDTQKKALEKALSKEMETVGMSRPQSMGATAQGQDSDGAVSRWMKSAQMFLHTGARKTPGQGGPGAGGNVQSDSSGPLPPGWEARTSRSSNKTYYANPRLKITQWERPTAATPISRSAQRRLSERRASLTSKDGKPSPTK